VLVDLARTLTETNARVVDLFSGALRMAGQGLIGVSGADPGELLSGALGKIGLMVGTDDSPAQKLAVETGSLASMLEGLGFAVPLLPPSASLAEITAALPVNEGVVSPGGGDIGAALSKLNEETIRAVEDLVAEALSSVSNVVKQAASALPKGEQRSQGVLALDGSAFESTVSTSAKVRVSAMSDQTGEANLAVLAISAPPIQSQSLSAPGKWTGAEALGTLSSILAEACAFNAALSASLDLPDFDLDKLLYPLECRRSTYAKLAEDFAAKFSTDKDLLKLLTGLVAMMAGGRVPCSQSNFPRGA
jgi:hypothetical protein